MLHLLCGRYFLLKTPSCNRNTKKNPFTCSQKGESKSVLNPCHVGVKRNEIAARVVKTAANNDKLISCRTYRNTKNMFKTAILSECEQKWLESQITI